MRPFDRLVDDYEERGLIRIVILVSEEAGRRGFVVARRSSALQSSLSIIDIT